VTLRRLPRQELIDELSRNLAVGFDRFPRRHVDVVRALASADGWHMTLASDVSAAVPVLMELLASD
jgi:hypothetical protein